MVATPSHKSPLRKAYLAGLALILVIVAVLPATADASPAGVSVYDSLAVLRPDKGAPVGSKSAVELSAAQNEAESFQLLVEGGSGLAGVTVTPGAPLTGPGGETIPASSMTIYREGYYRASRRSDAEGEAGLWPDVLIPATDDIYGEKRNAFPVNIGAGAELASWIDILVPRGQTPGTYQGSVVVSSSAGTLATVPVTLKVNDFQIPSTSSLKSAFFTDAGQICEAFTGDSNCNGDGAKSWELESLFAAVGLNNRMTIANPVPSTPTGSLFTKYVLPLLDGTASGVELPGAKLTSIEAYGPTCAVSGSSCLSQWKTAAEKYDFASRFFLYNCDEPGDDAAWAQCKQNAQIADSHWAGVRKLVTATNTDVEKQGANYTDIVAPVVNYSDKASNAAATTEIYTSCMSFSCDGSESSSRDNGWPGYAIDQPASQARSMGWVSFAYNATGELYWNTTASLPSASTNQYVSGGNGDGNLFYAGTPGGGHGSVAIGGSHDLPLESIRLKRIRDGREDYEYMRILQSRGQGDAVTGVIHNLIGPDPANHTTVGAAALDAARNRLTALISGGVARNPLRVKVLRVRIPKSARQLRLHGVRALVRCSVACRVDLAPKVSHRTARRLGVHTTRLAKGSKRLGAHRKGWVVARLSPHARAKLNQVRSIHIRLRPRLSSHRA